MIPWQQSDKKGNCSSFLTWSSRGILAAVFFYAGITKIGDPDSLAEVIASYGLLPEILLYPMAVILPFLEIFAASGLVFNIRGGLEATCCLLLLFLFVVGYGLGLGLNIDCGCFEGSSFEHAFLNGLQGALIKDLLLLLPLSYLFWQRWKRKINGVEENE